MTEDSLTWKNKAYSQLGVPDKRFLFHQYDASDIETGVFTEKGLFKCSNFKQYYYRLEPFIETPRGKKRVEHFGVAASNEGSNSFDIGIYTNELLNDLVHTKRAPHNLREIINSNLGFHYESLNSIASLKHSEFENELSSFLSAFPGFEEIKELQTVKDKSGLYVMVLDDYACCYIGQSKDIKARIQQHWRNINFSTTGVDMFKALDTTRLFAVCSNSKAEQSYIDRMEYELIHSIDRKYLLNCLGGGGSLEIIHSDSPSIGYGSMGVL